MTDAIDEGIPSVPVDGVDTVSDVARSAFCRTLIARMRNFASLSNSLNGLLTRVCFRPTKTLLIIQYMPPGHSLV